MLLGMPRKRGVAALIQFVACRVGVLNMMRGAFLEEFFHWMESLPIIAFGPERSAVDVAERARRATGHRALSVGRNGHEAARVFGCPAREIDHEKAATIGLAHVEQQSLDARKAGATEKFGPRLQ